MIYLKNLIVENKKKRGCIKKQYMYSMSYDVVYFALELDCNIYI